MGTADSPPKACFGLKFSQNSLFRGGDRFASDCAHPTDDPLFGKGQIRVDGRHIHPMYLFETKKPSESIGKWDVFKHLATISSDDVWRPLDKGGCPFVKI